MNLLIIILAVTALTAICWGVLALYEFVQRDGYGHNPLPERPGHDHDDHWRRAA